MRERRFSRREFFLRSGLLTAGCAVAGWSVGAPSGEAHPAMFYEKLDGRVVRCRLCPWGCVVPEGGRGRCRVRENRGGNYYTRVYGRPVALNNDPIEKKPFFHVYPGSRSFSLATVGCNIRCSFCQNWDISQRNPEEVAPPYMPPERIVDIAARQQCRTIAYTYSEPIVFYEYMMDCARVARERGIGNVVVSNGIICEEPLKKLLPLLTAIKIDLKAFTEKFYEDICGGRLQPVLDTLKRIAAEGTWLEIVVLMIPSLNDHVDDIKRMADWIVKELGPNVPLHFTRFHPDYKLRNLPPTPLNTLNAARDAAVNQGCRFVYGGNAAGLRNNAGLRAEYTYCPECRTAVVERYGLTPPKIAVRNGRCPQCGESIPGVWT